MEITFEGTDWDPATESAIRAALVPLAAVGVSTVALVRRAIPYEEMWEAWVETHDGQYGGVVTWGDCHTLSDLLPRFLEELPRLAIAPKFRYLRHPPVPGGPLEAT